MNRPLVSIIIPVYNAENFLKRCMDPVIAQTYPNTEIIAVDDGSSDKSGIILDEYAEKYSRVKVIHQENQGQSSARNAALDRAEGQWIAFADSDDMCTADMAETLVSRALETGADICWGEYILHHLYYKTVSRVRMPKGVFTGDRIMDMLYKDPSAPSLVCAAVFRRELFDGLRFPAGRIYEDAWMIPRLAGKAQKAACVNSPVYHYFRRKEGTCGSSPAEKQLDLLWAKDEIIAYVAENRPDLEVYAQRKKLECCCDLLMQIDRLGRRENMSCWKKALAEFESVSRKTGDDKALHKCLKLMFRVSPVMLAKISRAYPFLRYRMADMVRRIKKEAP